METKWYMIDGVEYYQKPLVLGQIRQLYELINLIEEIRDMTDFSKMLDVFGDRASLFMAVVLTPKGVHPRDKDIHLLAKKLEDIPIETALEVAEDFLSMQDIFSLMNRIGSLSNAAGGIMRGIASSTPSPTETSPGEKKPSG